MRPQPARHHSKPAFTLLEVILALAILAGAVAVLGEVMSVASRNASDAQAETEAQMLAASVMDELIAGVVPLTQQSRQPLESDAAIPWVYSVTVEDTTLVGLTAIEVLVEQDVEKQFRPVKYRLVRWFVAGETANTSDAEPDSPGDSSDA